MLRPRFFAVLLSTFAFFAVLLSSVVWLPSIPSTFAQGVDTVDPIPVGTVDQLPPTVTTEIFTLPRNPLLLRFRAR